MPEGPSIVILREEAQSFVGKKVERVAGNTKIDQHRLVGQKVLSLRSWGKHFLIEFEAFSLRIHFLLFGTYRINERKESVPRLRLGFRKGELNFYACSVQFIEGPLDATYDWRADVMSDAWDPRLAKTKLRADPEALACDALLNQHVFAGVGNIIKNEVLFRIRVHPLSTIGALSTRKLNELVAQARQYSFEFLEWKKAFVLKKHWLVHTRSVCPRCHIRLHLEILGRTQRRTFYCSNCQKLYGTAKHVFAKRASAKRAGAKRPSTKRKSVKAKTASSPIRSRIPMDPRSRSKSSGGRSVL
jgi:endonuclease VIII